MDSSIFLITAILIAITVVPFVLMGRNGKKKKKQFLSTLEALAKQHKSKISQCEFGGEFAIGLDETSNYIFFYQKNEDMERRQDIDLSEIMDCQLVKTKKTVRNGNGSGKQEELDKLELSFSCIAQNKPNKRIEFYNSDQSAPLSGELELMDKWSKIINARLSVN